jgi:ATP-dependent DNA ligase
MLAMAGDEKQIDQMIASANWHFERKYDGERCVIEVAQDIHLYNRTGKEINSQFPELAEMATKLPKGIYDGEIFVESNTENKDKPTTAGRTGVRASEAKMLGRIKPATYKCFDVIEYEGRDIRNEPYEARKEILARVDSLRIQGFDGVFPEENPKLVWNRILRGGDEGMVAKRVGSRYEHLRSSNWVKLKTWQEEDFLVVGITSEKREISALVLDNGMKVNCSLNGLQYNRLLSDLVKADSVIECSDGTLAVKLKKTYTAKVKFLHKSQSGLRFPILHELEGY